MQEVFMEFTPKDWKKIPNEDYAKYGIGENTNLVVLSAFTFENNFIELVECDDDPNFMRDVVVEYYGLISDKEMQANMGIEPKWLFQNKVGETDITLTLVQSLAGDKIYSASIFFNKKGKNYGLNILSANFPTKEFDFITSKLYSGIEELILNF